MGAPPFLHRLKRLPAADVGAPGVLAASALEPALLPAKPFGSKSKKWIHLRALLISI